MKFVNGRSLGNTQSTKRLSVSHPVDGLLSVWRDPYYRRWGERLFTALFTLLALAIATRFVAELLMPFVPFIIGTIIFVFVMRIVFGRRY